MRRVAWGVALLIALAAALRVDASIPGEPETQPPAEFSPLFSRRLEVGIHHLDAPPGRLQVAALARMYEEYNPLSLNPTSFCAGSACLGSFCGGSMCLLSNCAGSACGNSKCVGSGCGVSLCGGSACTGSVCLGSLCLGSACAGSACLGCATQEPPLAESEG
jgi:hypothetical protein